METIEFLPGLLHSLGSQHAPDHQHPASAHNAIGVGVVRLASTLPRMPIWLRQARKLRTTYWITGKQRDVYANPAPDERIAGGSMRQPTGQ